MGMSDIIAAFILSLLENENGIAELQRSELAERFKCVPSQINYVISTRFSPEHGYIVESRRGGNGYIRITRVAAIGKSLIMHTLNSIGDEIDLPTAAAFISNALNSSALEQGEARLILAAISDKALKPVPAGVRDAVRASILKHLLINSI